MRTLGRFFSAWILLSVLVPVSLMLTSVATRPPPEPERDPSGRAIRDRVEPAWPDEALATEPQVCGAEVQVDRHGAPVSIDAEACPPALGEPAVEALQAWRWYPLAGGLAGWLDGVDEATTTSATVTFVVPAGRG